MLEDGKTSEEERITGILTEAKAHAEKNRVEADDKRGKCVDGGYKKGEAEGALAFPGGHLGLAMNLLALGYSPREAFDATYKLLNEQGVAFGWHTDKHEGHHGTIVGCGHCNAAIQYAEEYGLNSDDVAELLEIIREAQAEGEREMECVVLDREHAEQGVLVILDADQTVNPWDQENDVQYFIYDQTRHMALLDEMAEKLGLDREELQQEVDKQTAATLGLLGSSKGKPMISVKFTDLGEADVELVGYAPVIEPKQ